MAGNFPSHFFEDLCWAQRLLVHIGEPLNCHCKISDGFIRIAMLNSIADTVLDMPFQNHLPRLMEGGFGCIDLRQNILSVYFFIVHAIDSLHVADDFFQAAVEVLGIHTLFHCCTSY